MEVLLGGVVGFAFATVVEGYFLMGRAQRLMTHAELLLSAAGTLLATVPGKSAPPTAASPDEQPRRWWQRLRALPEPEELEAAAFAATDVGMGEPDVELARWQDDGGQEPAEPVDLPVLGPATVPEPAAYTPVLDCEQLVPVPDEVDLALARFTFAGGRRAGRPAALPATDGGN